MTKEYKDKIEANGIEIAVISTGNEDDFISLTDIAKHRDGEYPSYAIQNWMRNRNTIRYLGLWERLHNPDFNSIGFDRIESEAGTNGFIMTPKQGPWRSEGGCALADRCRSRKLLPDDGRMRS